MLYQERDYQFSSCGDTEAYMIYFGKNSESYKHSELQSFTNKKINKVMLRQRYCLFF